MVTECVIVLVIAIVVVAFDHLTAFSLELVVPKIVVQPMILTVTLFYVYYFSLLIDENQKQFIPKLSLRKRISDRRIEKMF